MDAELRADKWLAERPPSLKPWLTAYADTFPDSPGGKQASKALDQLGFQGFIDHDVLSKLKDLWLASRVSWTEYQDLNELFKKSIHDTMKEMDSETFY